MTNPVNNPCIQTVLWITTKLNHLFIGLLPTFLKISRKSVWKLLSKVANRETDRQTNKQRRKHNLLGEGKNRGSVEQ